MMRALPAVCATGVLIAVLLQQNLSGVGGAPQAGPTLDELREEFERAGMSRQLELGEALIKRGDREVLAKLERWLSDEDRHVRANVALVFAGLGNPRGFQVLGDILNDRSSRRPGQGVGSLKWSLPKQIEADRYYAVHILGHLRKSKAVDLLLPLLSDAQVGYKVAWALGETGDVRAIAPLIDKLRDPDALVRTYAIGALAKLKAKEALPQLRTLLNDRSLPRAGDQLPVGTSAKAAIEAIERRQ